MRSTPGAVFQKEHCPFQYKKSGVFCFFIVNLFIVNLFSKSSFDNLKDWINENTSGVVIVQIRDTPKEIKITQNPVLSLFKSLSNPLGGFTKNWLKIQTYDQDLLIQFLADGLNTNISIYDLALKSNPNEEIPISWHLTQNERENIKNAIEDSLVKNQISKLSS